ncbi:MAG: hypothetical protein AAGF12_07065 [Myxococcota bacterium]
MKWTAWSVGLMGCLGVPSFAMGQASEPSLLDLEGVGLEEVVVPDVPRSAARRRSPHGGYRVDREGRLYFRRDGGDYLRTEVTGSVPMGAVLVPAVDLDTVRFASLPTEGVAVLIPGSQEAWIIDPWGASFSLPTEFVGRPNAVTEFARGMRTCPSGAGPCLLIGAPRAVRRAVDRREPPSGYLLVKQSGPAAVPGLDRAPPEDIDLSLLAGTTKLRVRAVTLGNRRLERVFLMHNGNEHHAFDTERELGHYEPLEPRYTAAAVGDRIYVHNFSGTVSAHDRSGRRLGPPHRVGLEAYYEVCSAGDDGFTLVPVLGRRRIEFALITIDGNAFVYPRPGHESVRVSIAAHADRVWDIAHFERAHFARTSFGRAPFERTMRLTPRFIRRH